MTNRTIRIYARANRTGIVPKIKARKQCLIKKNKRSVSVPHAPSLSELGVSIPKELQSVHEFAASGGTAVVLPPGVSQERVEYLRKAFQTLSKNEGLQKAIEKLTGDRRSFVSGQELQKTMVDIKAGKELSAKLDALFKKYSAIR